MNLLPGKLRTRKQRKLAELECVVIILLLLILTLQVTELVLDNARCSEVTGLSDKFTNLHRLSIVNAGLSSLKGLPPFPNLKEVLL